MELFPTPASPAPESPHVFTVTEVTQVVRQVLEEAIGQVWVEGEVSNLRKQPSGHQYFTLKDERCQLQCVMFARQGMWRKAVSLSDGMHVIARGTLSVYEARGQYQLNVQHVQAGGAGLLQAKFEALKQKLQAEGLFDSERKRAIPPFPIAVGIVTSPSGAVIRDMLNVLGRRAPWIHVIVNPVRVQGEGAAAEIAEAIRELNDFERWGWRPVDVIVVARGGGSIEDLWQFNEETVARAIAASEIPVISAVGHEIDFTIADFVADLRAPTPSAAAELVAPDRAELQRRIEQVLARLQRHLTVICERHRHRLAGFLRGTLHREPVRCLQSAAQRLDSAVEGLRWAIRSNATTRKERLQALNAIVRQHRPDQQLAIRRQQVTAMRQRLGQALKHQLAEDRRRLASARDLLELISPQATLERGYTITSTPKGKLLTSAVEAAASKRIVTRFAEGSIEAEVIPPVA